MMEKVCRTCLRAPSNLIPIQMDDGLVHKIERISSIQLSLNEFYPSSICEECLNNINKFYCFQKVIINNDKELRERYDTLKKTNFVIVSKPCTKEIQSEERNTVLNKELDLKEVEETIDDKGRSKAAKDLLEVVSDIGTDASVKIEKISEKVDCIKKAIAKLCSAKCTECNLTFTSRLKLYNHRRMAHIAPGICNICGMTVRADNLKKHLQIHTEGPVTCQTCQKVFKNPQSLRCHLFVHKGLQFTCEFCGKVSRVKSEHHRHLKSHKDPDARKITCKVCGKKVLDQIKRHMRTHTGERPHSCPYCKRSFTSSNTLKVHLRQHTNEKPFTCDFCSMGFPQKVSLVTHLKSKHNVLFS